MPVFLPEARSSEAEAILLAADEIVISSLTQTEFLVALNRLRKLGTLSEYQHELLIVTLEGQIQDGFLQLVNLESRHFALAVAMARQSVPILRTLDALHLAVASSLGSRLATFDSRLAEAAEACGILVTG